MSRLPASLSAHLDCLFENEIVGFVVLRDGLVVSCNRCFARMLGREEGEVLSGLALADLAGPGESRDVLSGLLAAGPGQTDPAGQVFLRREDGSYAVCRVSRAAPCAVDEWDAPAAVLLVQDLSEHARLAEEYNKSMLDLEEAKLVQEENANMLSDALVQLELAEQAKLEKEKLQGIVELAIAAAHELSQPLQAVQNDVYFLRSSLPAGGEEEQALDAIDGALADLEKTITRIRRITTYKITEYTKNTRMLDLDGSSDGEDPGKEG